MIISYREMTPFDIPVASSMERAIYLKDAWSTAQFKEELSGVPRNRYYIVALNESGAIVGYAGIFTPDEGIDADIHTLTVAPEYRRQGIGRGMLDELITWALSRNCPAVFLEVRELNDQAHPLYLSAGFAPISRRNNYYGSGLHAVIMKKDLS